MIEHNNRPTKLYTRRLIVASPAVAAIALSVGCGNGSEQPKATPTKLAQQSEPTLHPTLTPDTLQPSASEQTLWNNLPFLVLDKSNPDPKVLELQAQKRFADVVGKMLKSQNPELKNGESVTVKGTIGKQTIGVIDMSDCTVVK